MMVLAGAAVETGGFEAPSSIVIGYKIPGNLLKLASEISQIEPRLQRPCERPAA